MFIHYHDQLFLRLFYHLDAFSIPIQHPIKYTISIKNGLADKSYSQVNKVFYFGVYSAATLSTNELQLPRLKFSCKFYAAIIRLLYVTLLHNFLFFSEMQGTYSFLFYFLSQEILNGIINHFPPSWSCFCRGFSVSHLDSIKTTHSKKFWCISCEN